VRHDDVCLRLSPYRRIRFDLIAPSGFVDAGDAGIRSSGNLNIAALQILNAWRCL
jgi:hypothetical protein